MNPFQCSVCKKVLANRFNLDRHLRTVHGGEDQESDAENESDEESEAESDGADDSDSSDNDAIIGDILAGVISKKMSHITSVDDMIDSANYKELLKNFREEVGISCLYRCLWMSGKYGCMMVFLLTNEICQCHTSHVSDARCAVQVAGNQEIRLLQVNEGDNGQVQSRWYHRSG